METINMYLDNAFTGLPQTPELLKAKEELRGMMEDKYRELQAEGKAEHEIIGIVISEFGNIEELLEELGVSKEAQADSGVVEEGVPVSFEQTEEFFEANKRAAKGIGIGVGLCITSPALLVLLEGLSTGGFIEMTQGAMDAVGLLVLFLMIGVAVALFIIHGIGLEKYDYLKKEVIDIPTSVSNIYEKRKQDSTQGFAIKIAVGVGLCIFSVVPIILLDELFPRKGLDEVATSGMFVFIAVAVYLFVTAGMERESYSVLLQEEDYRPQKKKANRLVEMVGGIYWPIITILYLGYSFLSADWHISWIIWPIAGIVFGIIAFICNIIEMNGKNK